MEIAYGAASWLLTYFVHSTVLLSAAWMLTRLFGEDNPGFRDLAWKTAAVGALLTSTLVLVTVPSPTGVLSSLDSLIAGRETGAATTESAMQNVTPAGGALVETKGSASFVVSATGDESAGVPYTITAVSGDAIRDDAATPVSAAAAASDVLRLQGVAVFGILGVWMVPALLLVVSLQRRRRRFLNDIGVRTRVHGGPMAREIASLSKSTGHHGTVLTNAPRISSPAVLSASEICVPRDAVGELSDGEQRSLIAHEFAHVIRRDPMWLRTFHLLERVFFFQPLNRVARSEYEEAAEELCDAWVVDRTGDSETLASCLVRIARFMKADASIGFASIAGRPLRARIQRLLSSDASTPRMRPLPLVAMLSLILVIAAWGPSIAVSGSEAASGPARADSPVVGVADVSQATGQLYATAHGVGPTMFVTLTGPEKTARFVWRSDTVAVDFSGNMRYEVGDGPDRAEFSGAGTVVLSSLGTITRISRGGRLVVESGGDQMQRKLVARPSGQAIEYTYEELGTVRPYSAAAQDWVSAGIKRLVERHVKLRVAANRLAEIERARDRSAVQIADDARRLRLQQSDITEARKREIEEIVARSRELSGENALVEKLARQQALVEEMRSEDAYVEELARARELVERIDKEGALVEELLRKQKLAGSQLQDESQLLKDRLAAHQQRLEMAQTDSSLAVVMQAYRERSTEEALYEEQRVQELLERRQSALSAKQTEMADRAAALQMRLMQEQDEAQQQLLSDRNAMIKELSARIEQLEQRIKQLEKGNTP